MNNARRQLLTRLQAYAFSMYDCQLYLDTHPRCARALRFFEKYQKLYKTALAEYSEKYGPIDTASMRVQNNEWTWIDSPWPWETEV